MLEYGTPPDGGLLPSEIPDELIQAYRAAHYRVLLPKTPFVLKVDTHSPELASLLKGSGLSSAAFITACNPFGRRAAENFNAKAQSSLKYDLLKEDCRLWDGIGEDPQGLWPAEPSFLALGIGLESAKFLGERYAQNALLYCGPEALPKLILLR